MGPQGKWLALCALPTGIFIFRGVSGAFEPLPPETLETMTLLDHLTRSLPVISAYGAVVGGHSFLSWKAASVLRVDVLNRFRLLKAAREFVDGGEERVSSGAFYTLVPIRPRWRGERRSLRTFSPGASLRPPPAFNSDTPRRLSTPLLTPMNSTPTSLCMERPSVEDAGKVEGVYRARVGPSTPTLGASLPQAVKDWEELASIVRVAGDDCRFVVGWDRVRGGARSIHWSPYDRVRVVNADP
jgi:hypothetical protein